MTRTEDVVARTGGDEFVILLEGTDCREAAATSQRIVDGFREPLHVGDRTLSMSLSVGVACFPADGTDVETLLRNADAAMYHAKRSQRGAYRLFETSMHDSAVRQFHLESELRGALAANELLVHYEPIVSIDGAIIGAEAVPVWPLRGALLSAAEFIPIAETTGLVVQLDAFVLREACRRNAHWMHEGRRLTVGVGISAQSIAKPGFVTSLRAALDESGVEPRLLELVLSETSLQGDLIDAATTIDEIGALGVRIALRDFGTGSDSLGILRSCSFETVLLGRELVRGLAVNDVDMVVASALLFAAHGLDARVVAEGVETEAQRVALVSLRCDAAQGSYFGAAMPPAAFGTLLDTDLPIGALGRVA